MRFILLHHTAWPGHADHYDLLLQSAPGIDDNDRVLLAFSTQTDAPPNGSRDVLLRKANHRRAYLNVEGESNIPGTGRVARCDRGALEWRTAPVENFEKCEFVLSGKILNGLFSLKKSDDIYVLLHDTHTNPQ